MEHIEELKQVYSLLEDEISRQIYLNRIGYFLTEDDIYIGNILKISSPELGESQYNRMKKFFSSIPQTNGIIIYGVGENTTKFLNLIRIVFDENLIGFSDKDVEKQAKEYIGKPCFSPENLISMQEAAIIIMPLLGQDQILYELKERGMQEKNIFMCPNCYRESTEQYFEKNIVELADEEVMIDAGSYDLSTALKYRDICKGKLKKVYALEPDPINYAACIEKKNMNSFDEAELIPCGSWSKKTKLLFSANGPSGSFLTKGSGEISVDTVALDDIVPFSERVTMIKMDVEGAELESLKGAKGVICRDRPKLAICIYHKPEDLVEIPLYIKKLIPEYKLYIRHYANDATETVLYAVTQ
ncbi:MAG: FkbM family methyltransferase [Lachnospiraceae bacterium]|nr:FkbM family methyltransferase [Lachnospiraceae bacterium]